MSKPMNSTLSEILGHPATLAPSLEEVKANYAQVVAEVEAELGPQVPARLVGRGRPRKGIQVEATHTHSLRLADSVWQSMAAKARASGISLNQAASLALMEWASLAA